MECHILKFLCCGLAPLVGLGCWGHACFSGGGLAAEQWGDNVTVSLEGHHWEVVVEQPNGVRTDSVHVPFLSWCNNPKVFWGQMVHTPTIHVDPFHLHMIPSSSIDHWCM
jgi:hypothetical protein